MTKSLISIIVPVYKVERYLDKCVESILNQTYKNIEVILVDDGSPDNCPQMCDEWAQKDARIKVVHKKNGGLSAARNTGMSIAKGDYIGFVDSDDYIDVHMYEKLLDALLETNSDMAICNYIFLKEDGNKVDGAKDSPIIDEILNRKQAYMKLDMYKSNYWYYVTAVNKLYKRKIFAKQKFVEGKINEDEFSIHHFMQECNQIVTIQDVLYFYIQHDNTIMTAPFSKKRMDALEAFLDRYNFFRNNKEHYLATSSLIGCYGTLLDMMQKKEAVKYKKEFGKWVGIVFKEFVKQKNLRAVKIVFMYIVLILKKS